MWEHTFSAAALSALPDEEPCVTQKLQPPTQTHIAPIKKSLFGFPLFCAKDPMDKYPMVSSKVNNPYFLFGGGGEVRKTISAHRRGGTTTFTSVRPFLPWKNRQINLAIPHHPRLTFFTAVMTATLARARGGGKMGLPPPHPSLCPSESLASLLGRRQLIAASSLYLRPVLSLI